MGNMAACPHCGAENLSFARVCARCGINLERPVPEEARRDNLVMDIVTGVFLGMVAFSIFGGLIWGDVVLLVLR